MNAGGGSPDRVDPDAVLIVTRPEPDATRLVDGLVARGHRAFAFPALAIGAPADGAALARRMALVEDDGLVIFVSPNAIRHALAARAHPWPGRTAIGVMGPGSVATLREAGIASTIVAPAPSAASSDAPTDGDRFDSEALFSSLDREIGLTRGFAGRVLIVRGNGGRGWLAGRLRSLGLVVDEIEAYRRSRGAPDGASSDALRTLFRDRAPRTFIVTSSEAVDDLVALVTESLAEVATPGEAREWLLDSPVLAPHRRIVEKAEHAGFRRVLGVGPGDRGLFAAIE